MSDEACDIHQWGDAEECETTLGLLFSPVCRHCGAVKLEQALRQRDRAVLARRIDAFTRGELPGFNQEAAL